MHKEKGQWVVVVYTIQGNKIIEAVQGDYQNRMGAISEIKMHCVRKLFSQE